MLVHAWVHILRALLMHYNSHNIYKLAWLVFIINLRFTYPLMGMHPNLHEKYMKIVRKRELFKCFWVNWNIPPDNFFFKVSIWVSPYLYPIWFLRLGCQSWPPLSLIFLFQLKAHSFANSVDHFILRYKINKKKCDAKKSMQKIAANNKH